MEIMSPSSNSLPPATHDEFYLRQSRLLFSDSLKDLTNLRSQLYSAADYFEFCYTNEEHKQIVADTLKDYAIKALVNTVDHLGSASYKVDHLLNEKTDEVAEADLRVSCIEQRLGTCHECIDLAGFSQQSLVLTTPKYHKRYILPMGESMPESGRHAVAHVPESHTDEDEAQSRTFQDAIRSTIMERTASSRKGRRAHSSSRARSSSPSRRTRSPSPLRRARSPSPSPQQPLRSSTLPAVRSGSVSVSVSVSVRPNLVTSPPSMAQTQRFPAAEIRKSSSMHVNSGGDDQKQLVKNPSKTKGFLMSLLRKHKVKKDDMLYTFLDEY